MLRKIVATLGRESGAPRQGEGSRSRGAGGDASANKSKPKSRRLRPAAASFSRDRGRLVWGVFVVFVLIGVIGSSAAHRAENAATVASFQVTADALIDRLHEHVEREFGLLDSTVALASVAGEQVDAALFRRYIESLRLKDAYVGVQAIGYAPYVATGAEAAVVNRLAADYAITREVWPATQQPMRTPISLIEPQDERNRGLLGYDMFSELSRREAIIKAMQDRQVSITVPLELFPGRSDATQKGFFAYRAVPSAPQDGGRPQGFVQATFQAGALHRAVLGDAKPAQIEIQTRDTTSDLDSVLYQSSNFAEQRFSEAFQASQAVIIGGREWTVTARPGPGYKLAPPVFTYAVSTIFAMLAILATLAALWWTRARDMAHEVNDVLEKAADEKELLLHETKHRIKNSIARIIAIARQTGLSSKSIQEFNTSFATRLQAMVAAQDVLTRSQGRETDLRSLLKLELAPVFGPALNSTRLEGPDVRLTERMVQALGLTFHELATNSLKYGAAGAADGEVLVRWRVVDQDGEERLELEWREVRTLTQFNGSKRGFGTRLVDINIGSELGGLIDRIATGSGLAIRMQIPLPPQS
ncbi:CHASE domain-containing protein [Rhizobium sp. RU36D]|uniref:CHASE domain-containing protein n=1 Tax=Rhizobium sp. RU36D TaxID=1907415 RepID=UPI0009D8E05C|nr:CHASE domain-containing protein [Rhizobium sp. RU36D]SMD01512.1 Two-component sensor histidine kinase, contains HisKA and HATPase domains [Rhizobium sp. RU36D]